MSKSKRFVEFVWWFIWCASGTGILWAVPWTKVWTLQMPVVAALAIGAGLVLLALITLVALGRGADDPDNEPDRSQPS